MNPQTDNHPQVTTPLSAKAAFDIRKIALSDKFEAEVIQYLMPDGRQKQESTHLPKDYEYLYLEMRKRGLNFSAEMLQTNEISLCIEDRTNEKDLDCEIVSNGPNVQPALCDMLVRTISVLGSAAKAGEARADSQGKENQ